METTDRLALKCLVQCQRQLAMAVNEGLCAEPDRALVRRLVQDAQAILAEFEDAYPDTIPPVGSGQGDERGHQEISI